MPDELEDVLGYFRFGRRREEDRCAACGYWLSDMRYGRGE